MITVNYKGQNKEVSFAGALEIIKEIAGDQKRKVTMIGNYHTHNGHELSVWEEKGYSGAMENYAPTKNLIAEFGAGLGEVNDCLCNVFLGLLEQYGQIGESGSGRTYEISERTRWTE